MISNEMRFTASCRVERGQSKSTDGLSKEAQQLEPLAKT